MQIVLILDFKKVVVIMVETVGALARVDQVVAEWRSANVDRIIGIIEMILEPLVEVSGVMSSPLVDFSFVNSFFDGRVIIKTEPILSFSSCAVTVEEEAARVMLETLFAMVMENGPLEFTVDL